MSLVGMSILDSAVDDHNDARWLGTVGDVWMGPLSFVILCYTQRMVSGLV